MDYRRLVLSPVLVLLSASTLWAAADDDRVYDSKPKQGSSGSPQATEQLTERLETKQKTEQEHPRRTQVEAMAKHTQKRINSGVKDGTISPGQAKQLNSELKGIKADENSSMKANGGTLSPDSQQRIDKDLQKESKEMRLDRAKSDH